MRRRHRGAIPSSVPTRFDLYRAGTSGSDGRVQIGRVVPGEYKVFAWRDIEANAWQNAEIMKGYEDRGAAVTVDGMSTPDIKVRLMP